MPYLETPILYLRALEPEDLEWLYAIENDKELWDSTSTNLPLSRYALKQYISQQPQDIYQCGEIRLAICLKEDDTPIGLADLINFEPVHSHAEVGITILAKHQNKGYGKMVLQLLEEYAEKKNAPPSTFCLCFSRNQLSKHKALSVSKLHSNSRPSTMVFYKRKICRHHFFSKNIEKKSLKYLSV